MPNPNIKFTVEPTLSDKGLKIKFATFTVPDIPRRRGSALKNHINDILTLLNIDELLQSPIITEYKKLQKEAGIQEPTAPVEYVLNGLQKVCDNIKNFCNGEYVIHSI